MSDFFNEVVHSNSLNIFVLRGYKNADDSDEMEIRVCQDNAFLLFGKEVPVHKGDSEEVGLIGGDFHDSENLDHPVDHVGPLLFSNLVALENIVNFLITR